MKMKHTGCAKYIKDNKKKRPTKPEKSNHKAYKQWKKDIHWIAIALQTTSMGNETLIWVQDYTDGVKAWDTLMEKYDILPWSSDWALASQALIRGSKLKYFPHLLEERATTPPRPTLPRWKNIAKSYSHPSTSNRVKYYVFCLYFDQKLLKNINKWYIYQRYAYWKSFDM